MKIKNREQLIKAIREQAQRIDELWQCVQTLETDIEEFKSEIEQQMGRNTTNIKDIPKFEPVTDESF